MGVNGDTTDYKFEYPKICSPHANVLCKLLKGERIRVESPDWRYRSVVHDIVESLHRDCGWPIEEMSGDPERVDDTSREWAEYSLAWEAIEVARPKGDYFIAEVTTCAVGKCNCAKSAKWR